MPCVIQPKKGLIAMFIEGESPSWKLMFRNEGSFRESRIPWCLVVSNQLYARAVGFATLVHPDAGCCMQALCSKISPDDSLFELF